MKVEREVRGAYNGGSCCCVGGGRRRVVGVGVVPMYFRIHVSNKHAVNWNFVSDGPGGLGSNGAEKGFVVRDQMFASMCREQGQDGPGSGCP